VTNKTKAPKDWKLMTDKVLARMLTEPTGTHFLDSGGESGRGWQQRAGMGVDDFRARQPVRLEVYSGCELDDQGAMIKEGDGIVILDTFHYLSERLSYCHPLTLGLHAFGRSASHRDEPWLATMTAYAAKRITGDPDADEKEIQRMLRAQDSEYFGYTSFNSYNDENYLSSDIQGICWSDVRYGPIIILHTHNGADVRGGYSTPHIFTIDTDEPYDLFEWTGFGIACSALGTQDQVQAHRDAMIPELRDVAGPVWGEIHAWEHRSPGEWITYGGSFTGDPWKESGKPRWHVPEGAEYGKGDMLCPACSAPVEVWTRP
jgi:hypothetical protein